MRLHLKDESSAVELLFAFFVHVSLKFVNLLILYDRRNKLQTVITSKNILARTKQLVKMK